MPVEARDIAERFAKVVADRGVEDDHFESLARVFHPRRSGFAGQRVRGERLNDEIYDSTPLRERRDLAANLGGLMKPKESQWFRIRTDDEALNEVPAVKAWLAHAEDRTFKAIYSRRARFLSESGAVDNDLVTFGTASMWEGPNLAGDRLSFRSLALKDAYPLVNADNEIDTHFVRLHRTARQAVQEFGEDNLPDRIKEAAKGASSRREQQFDLIWAVMPREDMEAERGDFRGMAFASVVVDKEGEKKVRESGYREFPFIVPRWDISAGEIYGRSPAMIALGDANTLQAMAKTILVSGQRAADPPHWAVAKSIVGTPRMRPGGFTYVDGKAVKDFGGRPPIGPLLNHAQLPIAREMQQETRQGVARAFLREILRLPQDGPQMTATEVLERRREFLEVIGPVFGQLEADYIGRIPERAFSIMLRAGAFLPPPEELEGRNVSFVYESPVAQARKQTEAANVARFGELMQGYIGLKPELIDNFDFDEISRDVGDALGFKEDWIRPKEAVAADRDQRAQQQAAAIQLAQGEQMANIAERGAKAIEGVGRAAQQERR